MSNRNIFVEAGYSIEEVNQRVEDTFNEIFYGENRFYHEVEDMGYFEDTGNHDVRTEGMSYAMMMCVMMDKKEEFDRIWKWARTYMYLTEGPNAGYFSWSMHTDGSKNSDGPAPDGEEYFAMALFFASKKWGDGTDIFNYSKEAKDLLHTCIHKGEDKEHEPEGSNPMWNPSNHLIEFVPGIGFTDPSYHLPHFYELFALYAYEEDRSFWEEAAKASRAYLKKACNIETGLSAEYSEYDGRPCERMQELFGRHDWFYSDAYRTIANIAVDYEWFAKDMPEEKEWYETIAKNYQKFFCETRNDDPLRVYLIDGTVVEDTDVLHPVAMVAVLAQASLATGLSGYGLDCVKKFWETPLRTGDRRYYDNCLYMFAMLALSGKLAQV